MIWIVISWNLSASISCISNEPQFSRLEQLWDWPQLWIVESYIRQAKNLKDFDKDKNIINTISSVFDDTGKPIID